MPTDNLTLKFKEELDNRGISASLDEVSKFLQAKGMSSPQGGGAYAPRGSMPGSAGEGKKPLVQGLRTSTIEPEVSVAQNMFDLAASTLWHGVSSAAIGIPELMLGEEAPYRWDQMGKGQWGAKVGAVIGEAAGFMVPLKGISTGVRGIMSGLKGTKAIVGQTKQAVRALENLPIGVEADKAARIVGEALENPIIKQGFLTKYAVNMDELKKAEDGVESFIRMGLKDGFEDIGQETIEKISAVAMHGLRNKGVHVNSIGSWIERGLNTKFSVADKSKITKYIARATEMGVDFAIYNNVANGIQAIAGHQDFDPVGNTWHAFAFTSLLPWVERVKGGGKIPYFKGKKKLKKMLSTLNPQFYEGLEKDQANALIKVLRSSQSGILKDSAVGKNIRNIAARQDYNKEEAQNILKQIYDTHIKSPEKLYAEWKRLAGQDFLKSIPRMMLGGFYFNAQTLLDYNMLNNIDPEVLGTHILVGMFFTRMRKPLFKDHTPTITGMDGRERLMEYFNMDISTVEALATADAGRNEAGHIYAGVLNNQTVLAIEKLFKEYNDEGADVTGGTDKESLRHNDYDLVRWAFGMHETAQFSRQATQEEMEISKYKLENLSPESIKAIDAKLREIKFDRPKMDGTGEESVKLEEGNFDVFRDILFEGALEGQVREYINAVVEGARLMDINVGFNLEDFDISKHDIKTKLEIGKLVNFEGLKTKDRDALQWVHKWQQIRDVLEGMGFISDYSMGPEGQSLHRIDNPIVMQHKASKQHRVEQLINTMVNNLKKDNFGETTEVFIDPLENGFLDAMHHWRHRKSLNQSYGIIEGANLDAKGLELRLSLEKVFGKDVPHNVEDIIRSLRVVRTEGMDDAEWSAIKNKSGEENSTAVQDKIVTLARIWGNGKQDANWGQSRTIEYHDALGLVKKFESEGWFLTTRFAERVGSHYWSRFLETAQVTTGTKAILENFLLYNIARRSSEGDRAALELPDIQTARTLINRIEGSNPSQRAELEKQYTQILEQLEGMKGKYINIRSNLEFGRKVSATDFAAAVKEAHIMSKSFDKAIFEHYNMSENLVVKYGDWAVEVKDFLSELYRYDEATNQISFKWDEFLQGEGEHSPGILRENHLNNMRAKLDHLIKEAEAPDALVDGADVQLLKNLKNKLIHEEHVDTRGAEDNVNSIKEMTKEVEDRATKMQVLVREIVYDMNNFSRDRALGHKRLNDSIADLVTILKQEGIDVTPMGDNPTLPEVLQKFQGTARGIDTFIDRMSVRLRAWRKNYDEATFDAEQANLHQEYQHMNIRSGSVPASSTMQSNYSPYSEKFEHDAWEQKQLDLRDARNLQNEPGPIGGRQAREQKESIIKEIVSDVHDAIEKKKISEGLEGSELDASVKREHDLFMKMVFPQFLARNIGSEAIKVATLGFDSKGDPMLVIEDSGHGKGVLTMFFGEMADAGIDLHKLNHTGTYNNRKQNIENIQDNQGRSLIDRIISNSSGTDAQDMNINLEDAGAPGTGKPVIRAVRVITSFNTSLLVSKDKLYGPDNMVRSAIDGRERSRLNNTFFEWFRTKRDMVYQNANFGLIPDATRTKGKKYRKKFQGVWNDIYDVVVDMFEHPLERETRPDGTKGDRKDIWIVDSIAQRDEQLEKIHEGRGGGTNFEGFEVHREADSMLRHTKGDHKYVYIRGSVKHKALIKKLGGEKKTKEEIQQAQVLLKNLNTLYNKLAYGNNPTDNQIRQMVRAMYWDKITSQGFDKLINNIDNADILAEHGSKLFKYYSLAESSSSKTQGSNQFLREITWVDKESPFLEPNQRKSIDYALKKGKMEIVGIRDESLVGVKNKAGVAKAENAFSNESLVKRALDEYIKSEAYGKVGLTREAAETQRDKLLELIGSLDGSSSINAHTWIGTHFARVAYLHKGRMLRSDIPDELAGTHPHTAGTKPSGWFNSPEGSILMKTNFTFDKKVATMLDKLGIDMLTTESAAKMFNAEMIELKKSELKKENKSFDQILSQSLENKGVDSKIARAFEDYNVSTDKASINVADKMFQTWTKAKQTDVAVFSYSDVPVKGGISGAEYLDNIIKKGGIVKDKVGGFYKVEQMSGDKYMISEAKRPKLTADEATRAGLESDKNISEMGLENIFFGKTEDRKGITNVTYALTDFLSQEGINSYLSEYVDYRGKMENALQMTGSLQVSGRGRIGITDFLLHSLREEGAILDNTSTSLTEALIAEGVDPSSPLVRDNIQRIAHQWFMKDLRKPKTKGASYSVLIPFLEGSMPVYATINNKKRSLIYGGKKLSYDDGLIQIDSTNDWSKVKYVASVETGLGRRDIQITGAGEKDHKLQFEYDDPYHDFSLENYKDKIREKNHKDRDRDPTIKEISDSQVDKLANALMKTEKMEIEAATKSVFNRLRGIQSKLSDLNQPVLYSTLYNRLESSNRGLKGSNIHNKLYLHSLSLRMPNLGGDIAIHKVEGFYEKEQSNVVGVNLIDLAAVHQADFDVDALLSYHDSPKQLAREIFRQQGLAPDAKSYGNLSDYKINMFQTGKTDGTAGAGTGVDDPLQRHLQEYLISRDNFGKVKRIATGISALQKLEAKIFRGVLDGVPIPAVEGLKQSDPAYAKFLQRYKNTLQTIVDSMKKPNIMSKASSEDVIRFVLFGEKGNLDPAAYEAIQQKSAEYFEDGWKPLYDFSSVNHSSDVKRVYQDVILESINLLGRSTRILSDVVDEQGRRPPEVLEIYEFKNALSNFYAEPNKHMVNTLLKKYHKNDAMKNAVIEVFYGATDFTTVESVKKYLGNNKLKVKVPLKQVIGLRDGATSILSENENPTSVGNFIAQQFSAKNGDILGYSKRYNKNRSPVVEQIDKLLADIDTASILLSTQGNTDLFNSLESGTEVGDAFRTRLKEMNADAYGLVKSRDGSYNMSKKGSNKYLAEVQQYSIMSHVLKQQKQSLERFIVNGNKYNTTSRESARLRLRNVNGVLRHFERVEHDMIKELRKERGRLSSEDYDISKSPSLFKYFDMRDHNLTGRNYTKGKNTGISNPTDKMQYLYKVVERDGMTKYEKVGYIRPNKTFWARNGDKYVVLKNPLRWEPLEKVDVLDAYAMLHVTGQIRPEHFVGRESVPYFQIQANALKSNLGALSREIYERAEKAPNASEMWMWDTAMEDAMVHTFMENWALKNFDVIRAEGGETSYTEKQAKIFAVASYLLKPSPVFGDVVHSQNKDVHLPSFKVNKRLSKAVFRWLKKNQDGHQILRDISAEYGRNFRMRYDNVIPPESAPIFNSYFYTTQPTFSYKKRSPQLELIFDRGLDLYNPAIFHTVRDELKRYKDRSRPEWDENGELELMDRYGRYSDIASFVGMYKDVKDFQAELDYEKNQRKTIECGGG